LRYDSPVQMVMRFCTRDTHIDEATVPGGAVVLVLIGAANRDPAQFHAPDSFDIGRHPNNHVAFGDGIHACIGAHLARLQGRIVLGSVVERFPRLRLSAPDQPLQYGGYLLSRGLTSLPMVID
jgi:cytochrome P450